MEKKIYRQGFYSGERALFATKRAVIEDSVFDNGESCLKESSDLEIKNTLFRWKYPLWYCQNVQVEDSSWFEMARAGVWYTKDMSVKHCTIEAPKNFRKCTNLSLEDVMFANAQETLWWNDGVRLKNVQASKGDYFCMGSQNLEIENLNLVGNYAFDGVKNMVVRSSRLLAKDCFWNTENVTVYDSFISGEYLGWNAKNLTLVNCTIESLQGMCYVENLKLVNCKFINTTLCFEYSSVEADVTSRIDSVFNPSSGTIKAPEIGLLIIEKDQIDPAKTKITAKVDKEIDRAEWRK